MIEPGGPPAAVLAHARIARSAAHLSVHRAFYWLHLHEPRIRAWQLALLAIPAPPFGEQARAAWFLERFRELGLDAVELDREGNALATLGPAGDGPCVLLSAHLDTVFARETPVIPREEDVRILGPGACDNGAGLAALLAIAAALRFAGIVPPVTLLFAANVGEEGEGDLRGMRHLFKEGRYRSRIVAALALEGAGTATAVTRALGSRRFRLTVEGPGGHSWTDAGTPNPIVVLARMLVAFDEARLCETVPGPARTTLSVGRIEGGTSINSIPASASMQLDLRSSTQESLDRLAGQVIALAQAEVERSGSGQGATSGLTLQVETIGDRPAASLPETASLLESLRAVDRHLGLRTDLRLGSTDANLPLSLGVPALALAAGGHGGHIHTLAEWYDPTGRELALRRVLLLLLDTLDSVGPAVQP